MRLAIVGITVVDIVLPGVRRLPAWPRHTEFTDENLVFLRKPPVVTLGGNGANTAYVAAQRGATVTLHTVVGNDELGELARTWLTSAGCRVESPSRGGSGALNVTAASTHHERASFFFPGHGPRMPKRLGFGGEPSALLVCGWPHPALAEMVRAFWSIRREGGLTSLDTGPILGKPWTVKALRPVFSQLDLLLTNEHEVKVISGQRRLDESVQALRTAFTGHVVVKCGAKGVAWWPAGEKTPVRMPARRVRVVNTVGAGDAFNGALLASLCQGQDYPEALRQANAIAAQAVASPRGVLGVKRANSRLTDESEAVDFQRKTVD